MDTKKNENKDIRLHRNNQSQSLNRNICIQRK